jgi:Mg/Co/Ni transporter MgtE
LDIDGNIRIAKGITQESNQMTAAAERPKKEYTRDDTTIQVRAPKSADKKLELVANQRGMVKKDLIGRIIEWFVDLDQDLQSCILRHVSPETALSILDRLRSEAQAQIVEEGQTTRVRKAARRAAEKARRRAQQSG